MKFTFISTQEILPWGGSEYLWHQAACSLARQGHSVAAQVVQWPVAPRQILELERLGGAISWHCRRLTLPQRLLRKAGIWRDRNYAWLDGFGPDLVVISLLGHGGGVEEVRECRARNLRYALIVQSASEMHWPDDAALAELSECYENAAACWFVSQRNRNAVEAQLGKHLPNACVVRNPFNVAYDSVPPWPCEAEEFKLACVGRLEPGHKGQDLIIDVLRRPKWRGRNLSVNLIGRGKQECALRRLVEFHKLDRVRFAGWNEDIAAVWAQYHGLLMPSRSEGLPLALVEALLCGRMAIVTDVAGNAELLEDNVTGFVAAAPTPDLLDEAMERAWNRRQGWQEMGRLAALSVRKQVPPDPGGQLAQLILQMI
jgi:glycosyltransferase involved in cell wall biosynthesis